MPRDQAEIRNAEGARFESRCITQEGRGSDSLQVSYGVVPVTVLTVSCGASWFQALGTDAK
jgi:hypothetical protein